MRISEIEMIPATEGSLKGSLVVYVVAKEIYTVETQ
jgi:hypothetical protein